jgi:leader peptidase (prepilin peptidase)/N-methyltransferase
MADAAFLAGPPPAATSLLLLASPFIGSFLATAVYRLPRRRSVAGMRSACPACGHVLGPVDLLPMVGYLVRRGRCAYCGAPVAALYPLIELGALAAALWAVAALPGWAAWAVAVMGWFLIALAAIDAKHFFLPDALTLPLLALGQIAASLGVLAPGLAWPVAPLDAFLGAMAGFASLALIAWAYRRLRGRAGLGLGDAKLLAASGAWAGWQGLPSVVLIASLAALAAALALAAYRRRRPAPGDRLAFGPYLALGTWLVVLYGPMTFEFSGLPWGR